MVMAVLCPLKVLGAGAGVLGNIGGFVAIVGAAAAFNFYKRSSDVSPGGKRLKTRTLVGRVAFKALHLAVPGVAVASFEALGNPRDGVDLAAGIVGLMFLAGSVAVGGVAAYRVMASRSTVWLAQDGPKGCSLKTAVRAKGVWVDGAPVAVEAYGGSRAGSAAAVLMPLGVVAVGAAGHIGGSCSAKMGVLCALLGLFATAIFVVRPMLRPIETLMVGSVLVLLAAVAGVSIADSARGDSRYFLPLCVLVCICLVIRCAVSAASTCHSLGSESDLDVPLEKVGCNE